MVLAIVHEVNDRAPVLYAVMLDSESGLCPKRVTLTNLCACVGKSCLLITSSNLVLEIGLLDLL